MSNSPLVSYTNLTSHCNSPRNHVIDKITIHHMSGNMTAKNCADYFKTTSRKVSSNYCIGSDGKIAMSVEEKNRAWTSSNATNDHRAITIEVANDGGEPDWHVSDKALTSLIALCVDICKRNGIKKLNFTGDKNGNLTMHKWFANTDCPGKYLGSKFPYIADEVNRQLSAAPSATVTPKTSTAKTTGIVFRVRKKWSDVKSQVGAFASLTNAKKCADEHKGYYVFDDKGNVVYSPLKSLETIAQEVINGKWGNGIVRKTKLKAAGYDYNKVQSIVNKLLR